MFDPNQFLYLIKEVGAQKAVSVMDVEAIEDITIKCICRTIADSCETLENVLIDRILEAAKQNTAAT